MPADVGKAISHSTGTAYIREHVGTIIVEMTDVVTVIV